MRVLIATLLLASLAAGLAASPRPCALGHRKLAVAGAGCCRSMAAGEGPGSTAASSLGQRAGAPASTAQAAPATSCKHPGEPRRPDPTGGKGCCDALCQGPCQTAAAAPVRAQAPPAQPVAAAFAEPTPAPGAALGGGVEHVPLHLS